jgi:hypothetical protein
MTRRRHRRLRRIRPLIHASRRRHSWAELLQAEQGLLPTSSCKWRSTSGLTATPSCGRSEPANYTTFASQGLRRSAKPVRSRRSTPTTRAIGVQKPKKGVFFASLEELRYPRSPLATLPAQMWAPRPEPTAWLAWSWPFRPRGGAGRLPTRSSRQTVRDAGSAVGHRPRPWT